MLLPKDDADDGAAYLEIRAGAGGDEAAIFVSDLFRMYSRFSERQGWKMEIVNSKPSEPSGIKEVVAKINGKGVFKHLKYESGVHRVQRVPETESQGRIHTSTVTVAILPEVDEVQDIEIDKNDLRVDTYSHVQNLDFFLAYMLKVKLILKRAEKVVTINGAEKLILIN